MFLFPYIKLTIALVHIIAVNIDVTIPTDKVIAKPFTGPVPMKYKINAVNKVVILASKIVTNALEKPSRIADCGSLFFNSSLILENIKTFASTAIPTVKTIPAIPGSVKEAPNIDITPVINIRLMINDILAINPKPR